MKVLLTGASGFIGKNFLENAPKDMEIIAVYNSSKDVEKFVKEKKLDNVRLYKYDLTKKEETDALFEKIGKDIDYCIYLAGNVNIPLSIASPIEDLNMNAGALINFLQSCNKIKRFIYMSSTAVYEGNTGIVTTETKLNPKVPYCISKLACERYVKFFSSIGKIKNFTILRFGGAYGKYSEKKFLSILLSDILHDKKEIEVYGDGTNTINITYVQDTVKALIKCLNSEKGNITCNLGQDNQTITETIKRIAKIFNKDVKIKYTPKRKDQKYITFRIQVDFNDLFGFRPDYSFEQGIKEFAEGMKE